MNVSKLSTSVQKYVEESKPAPVELWDPPYCGELDIRIARNGKWYYNESPIERQRLVKLFSNILKKEQSDYYLVTPVEKIKIQVDDVPFLVVDLEVNVVRNSQEISFKTSTNDKFSLSPVNSLRVLFNENTQEPSPYVTVRKNLEGLLDRKTFYRLIEKSEYNLHNGVDWLGVWSSNTFFPILEKHKINILD